MGLIVWLMTVFWKPVGNFGKQSLLLFFAISLTNSSRAKRTEIYSFLKMSSALAAIYVHLPSSVAMTYRGRKLRFSRVTPPFCNSFYRHL